jgi:glycosyltransferase involved in cell wall biosynthesis
MTQAGAEAAKPAVAVIIPFYNGSRWIERALLSVFQQTVPADEVVVVNDGSSVEEQAALHDVGARYPIRIIDKPNGGQGSARNAGVDACSSEYLCFLDQDDFYLPDHIEVLVRDIPMNEQNFGFVYGDCMEADGEGNIIRPSMVKEHSVHPKHSIVDLLRSDMFILPSASMIDRKAYQAVGGFDEQFTGYEDDDLFMRLFMKGYTPRFVDRPVYVWCIHSESMSHSVLMSRSRFRYFKKLKEAFPDDPDRDRYYFRDCLVPRFGRAFVLDAIRAAKERSPYRSEINTILRDYAAAVRENEYVGHRYKLELTVFTTLATIVPNELPGILRVAARLPLIRRLIVNER